MARDIEEFLRRAAERRKQQQAGKPTPQAPPQPPPQQSRPVAPPPRQQAPPPEKPRRLVIDENPPVEIIELTEKDMRDQSVAEHVSSHIDTSDISSHAEHLGQRIQNVDDQTDARIHQQFDHDLSKLDDRESIQGNAPKATVDAVPPVAKELIEMLTKPKSIRQAILINEIMKRPDFD